jgi:flagellin
MGKEARFKFKEEFIMRIQNNVMALNTHRMYTGNINAQAKSAEKLSSGYRVNRAGDDAAGLAISEKMRAQVRGLTMAAKNSNDAISLVQTAEGALQEVHSMLQRMNELAVQSASDTNVTIDRNALQKEFKHLQDEIDQIADTTKFNDTILLNGDMQTNSAVIQVGAEEGQTLAIGIKSINTTGLSLTDSVKIDSRTDAAKAITSTRKAIDTVSDQRADLGALQNRLEYKVNNLNTTMENLQAAESRIRDTDMAKEMSTFTKNNILTQAATAMLAQANSAPQSVLQLLG